MPRSTPEQRAKAREWAARGFTLGMIAGRLGFAKQTVRRWLKPDIADRDRVQALAYRRAHHARLNRNARKYMRRRRAGTCPVCARPTPRQGVKRCARCRREDRKWLRAEIQHHWREGLSVAEIAAEVGVSPGAVSGQVARMRQEGESLPLRRKRLAS